VSFGSFLTGGIVGGALVYGSLTFHVVRTEAGVQFVPKSVATFAETYLDTRTFTPSDWMRHRLLVADIIAARKEHLFAVSAPDVFGIRPNTAQRETATWPANRQFR
jgi:hypothetical protein